jgi:hypothetical protein
MFDANAMLRDDDDDDDDDSRDKSTAIEPGSDARSTPRSASSSSEAEGKASDDDVAHAPAGGGIDMTFRVHRMALTMHSTYAATMSAVPRHQRSAEEDDGLPRLSMRFCDARAVAAIILWCYGHSAAASPETAVAIAAASRFLHIPALGAVVERRLFPRLASPAYAPALLQAVHSHPANALGPGVWAAWSDAATAAVRRCVGSLLRRPTLDCVPPAVIVDLVSQPHALTGMRDEASLVGACWSWCRSVARRGGRADLPEIPSRIEELREAVQTEAKAAVVAAAVVAVESGASEEEVGAVAAAAAAATGLTPVARSDSGAAAGTSISALVERAGSTPSAAAAAGHAAAPFASASSGPGADDDAAPGSNEVVVVDPTDASAFDMVMPSDDVSLLLCSVDAGPGMAQRPAASGPETGDDAESLTPAAEAVAARLMSHLASVLRWRSLPMDQVARDDLGAMQALPPQDYVALLRFLGAKDEAMLPQWMRLPRRVVLRPQWLIAPSMQERRSYTGAAACMGQVVVCGGLSGTERLATAECLDAALGVWARLPPMKARRAGVAACALGPFVYAVGGFDGKSRLASVERLDMRTRRWHEIAPMSERRGVLCTVALGRFVYALGGYDGNRELSSAERYDPATDSWSRVPSMSCARVGAAACAVGGKIYVVGGYDGNNELGSGECYDAARNEWKAIPSMSYRRSYIGAVAIDGRIWVVGGAAGKDTLAQAEVFDPATNEWSLGPQMCSKRAGVAACSLDGLVFACGGHAGRTLSVVEAMDPLGGASASPHMPPAVVGSLLVSPTAVTAAAASRDAAAPLSHSAAARALVVSQMPSIRGSGPRGGAAGGLGRRRRVSFAHPVRGKTAAFGRCGKPLQQELSSHGSIMPSRAEDHHSLVADSEGGGGGGRPPLRRGASAAGAASTGTATRGGRTAYSLEEHDELDDSGGRDDDDDDDEDDEAEGDGEDEAMVAAAAGADASWGRSGPASHSDAY